MNIKEQVLSIEQIQELQELGFDVEKYASMCWLLSTNEVNSFYPVNKQFWDAVELKYIPTLTIGDIISVLPPHIYPSVYHKKYGKEIEQTHLLIMYPYSDFGCLIRYKHHNQDTFVFESTEKPYIKALFETLKWCIKNKYIKNKYINKMTKQEIRNNAKYIALDNKLYDYVQQLVVDRNKKIIPELAVQIFCIDNIDDVNEVCEELNIEEDSLMQCLNETANVANHIGE